MTRQLVLRTGFPLLAIAGLLALPLAARSQGAHPAAPSPAVGAPTQAQKDAEAARALTLAAFARPAAAPPPGGAVAQIIAETAKEKVAAPPEPKPEWLSKDGLRPGGKGMQIKTPF
jgi:hypothetical protein